MSIYIDTIKQTDMTKEISPNLTEYSATGMLPINRQLQCEVCQ